jgi:hypothetical protein
MVDPVVIPDGSRYERKDLLKWLVEGNNLSPITKQPFSESDIQPDHDLKKRIDKWRNKQNKQTTVNRRRRNYHPK